MRKINAVLFDFDGTLQTGDKRDFANRLDDTASELQLLIADYEIMSIALRNSDFKEALGEMVALNKSRGGPALDVPYIEAYHKEHISGRYDESIRLFPETRSILESLREQKYSIALVTTRGGTSLGRLLERHQLGPYFTDRIVSRDSCKNRKPHPEPLLLGLKLARVEPCGALYVGDNQHDDVGAAHAAGVRSVLRSPSAPIQREGLFQPNHHIQTLTELPELLNQLNAL